MAKEYIEREAALKGLEDSEIGFCDDEPIQTRNNALKIIQNIPAVDVRPVVLCCNCEHYKTFGCSIGRGWCEAADRSTYDDFFCASGRWKSNSADMRERKL